MELHTLYRAALVLLLFVTPSTVLATCTIADAADIPVCNAALEDGETDIHVTGAFTCGPGVACSVRVKDRTAASGWITIRGDGHLVSRITNASGHCKSPVIWVDNSSYVLVRDIRITETYECGSGPSMVGPHDGNTVAVGPNSSHVLVTGMWIQDAATHGITVGHSAMVAVWDNDIVDARTYGIVSFGPGGTRAFTSNRIRGSGDAGIASGSNDPGVSIGYNDLLDNHLGLSYGYGGGQLLVEKPSRGVIVEHNVLYTSLPVSRANLDDGIELAADIRDVVVRNNLVWNPSRMTVNWHGTDTCASRNVSFSSNYAASPLGQPPWITLFMVRDPGCGTVATHYFYSPQGVFTPGIAHYYLAELAPESIQAQVTSGGWRDSADFQLFITLPDED